MQNIRIKKVTVTEVVPLQLIARKTFIETFASVNSEENMSNYLEENLSLEKLSSELQNTHSEFYFALLDNQIIAYLKLNFGQSQTELKDDKAVEIERIYVLREFQGKKVGQLLYNHAFDVAKKMNAEYLWLGVWEQNPKAINFYRKNGFVEFDKHIFKLGGDEQIDIMMKLKL